LARSVEDAAHVLALLEGGTPADLRGATLKGRRFADLQNVAKDDLRDMPRKAYDDALQRLKEAGAAIVPLDVPELNEAMGLSGVLYTTEAYGLWRDVIEANPEAMYPEILERFRMGKTYSGPDYVSAWSKLKACRTAWDAATASFDAVLAPTAPILPPNLDRLMSDHEYYVTENLLALRNTRIGNLMGLAALTLPTGTPGCGLMMLGYPGSEEALLRVGSAVESALT
jgi:aspartyl-tRNA(Asn)/glutamyl-tRNA(Gln) amidotransferase subunit A